MGQKPEFAGDLTFISLADVFQILGGGGSTGVLRIMSHQAPAPGVIYFVDGNPVNADNGPLKGIQAIHALFGWTQGKFDFRREEVGVERAIHNGQMEVVLDALRMLDEGAIEKLGPTSSLHDAVIEQADEKNGERNRAPVIKGPLIDYRYVIYEEEFRDGETIVPEGGYGSWIWVVLDGIVRMSRGTVKGPMTMSRLGKGAFIGSLGAFSFRSRVRTATASAEGNVQLGVLDIQRLSREYAFLSPEFRGLLLCLDGRLAKIRRRAVELWTGQAGANDLEEDKNLIMEQHSSKAQLFAIRGGKAHVVARSEDGDLLLMTLGKGDLFGHMPFADIGQEPNRAAVFGSDDLELTSLDAASLEDQYHSLSATFRGLVFNAAAHIGVTTRLALRLGTSQGNS